ncbi:hypothetical protein PoB_004662300 [Plakobranchus ocellatus]|uniref:Uncharacterized protein n=1 Tax=Plakobranchus ocellatus TaxID=259542 RepID=A0AAV4BLT0_9GAST|nr:hypothetical protein PoB_004662300 [Plakobranchus ocellatus]
MQWKSLRLGDTIMRSCNREDWRKLVARSPVTPQWSTRLRVTSRLTNKDAVDDNNVEDDDLGGDDDENNAVVYNEYDGDDEGDNDDRCLTMEMTLMVTISIYGVTVDSETTPSSTTGVLT